MSDKIESFHGEYRWLSNFWPCEIIYDGGTYPSTEHAFQAAKTLDITERFAFINMRTAGEAKRAGKKVTLRADWQEVKFNVMRQVLAKKFTCTNDLGKQLVATGDAELIEGNTWNDTIWGVCNGVGDNMLGKLLMELREHLKVMIGPEKRGVTFGG
jgi:ribA/ribD-fused uncharacterized protein